MPLNHPIENSSTKRKLASILFADIVGYTALMQKDLTKATASLRKFHKEMESKVDAYKGIIVNEMGDGMLCIFEVPTDAVRCAMALKKSFEKDPIVPVRLAIHGGIVMSEGGKVYGDSINVASRIESMGVPGAVLISNRVRRDVKNQADIQTASLGSFTFKNVDEPMKVFAIANKGFIVPDKKELKGKFEKKKGALTKSMVLSISLVALILASGLTYMFYNKLYFFNRSIEVIQNAILNERIAVVPFENLTGDSSFDVFGKIAANWVNQGLMDIEDVEVVSPFTVQSNMDALGILPNDPSNRSSFSEMTGAKNIITGTYFIKDDVLVSALEIQDAISGKLLHSFSHVTSEVKDKETNIDKLRSIICGYWASKEMVDSRKIKVPDYEIYQLYLEFIKGSFQNAQELVNKILTTDSTFYLARLYFLNTNRMGLLGSSQIHFEFLDRHYADLSLYERQWFEFAKYLYLGDSPKTYEAINRLRLKYPKDFQVNNETALVALTNLNNPELAQSIYNEMPINYLPKKEYGFQYTYRMLHSINIAQELNDTTQLREHYESMNFAEGAKPEIYLLGKIRGASLLNESEEYDYYLNEYFTNPQTSAFVKIGYSNWLWSNIYSDGEKEKTHEAIMKLLENSANTRELRSMYPSYVQFLEGKSVKIDFDSIVYLPKVLQISALQIAGRELAKIGGNNFDLEKILTRLEDFISPDLSMTAPWGAGYANYSMAVIFTQLGELDKAITFLRKSRDLGFHTDLVFFNYDPYLAPLYNLQAFKELNEPRWPDHKG